MRVLLSNRSAIRAKWYKGLHYIRRESVSQLYYTSICKEHSAQMATATSKAIAANPRWVSKNKAAHAKATEVGPQAIQAMPVILRAANDRLSGSPASASAPITPVNAANSRKQRLSEMNANLRALQLRLTILTSDTHVFLSREEHSAW